MLISNSFNNKSVVVPRLILYPFWCSNLQISQIWRAYISIINQDKTWDILIRCKSNRLLNSFPKKIEIGSWQNKLECTIMNNGVLSDHTKSNIYIWCPIDCWVSWNLALWTRRNSIDIKRQWGGSCLFNNIITRAGYIIARITLNIWNCFCVQWILYSWYVKIVLILPCSHISNYY